MNTDPIYEADGKISVRKAVPFGLQHVLAMFVANIAPILIVTGVVKMPASEAGAVVQAAMIIAGIGSLLQAAFQQMVDACSHGQLISMPWVTVAHMARSLAARSASVWAEPVHSS